MVDFIKENYIIILGAAAFLIFALIGFVVDSSRNKKSSESNNQDASTNTEETISEVPVIENTEQAQDAEKTLTAVENKDNNSK